MGWAQQAACSTHVVSTGRGTDVNLGRVTHQKVYGAVCMGQQLVVMGRTRVPEGRTHMGRAQGTQSSKRGIKQGQAREGLGKGGYCVREGR